MTIEVAIAQNDSQKDRGDLLEKLSKQLLESQNHEVITELRNTGVEIDLLCTNKANSSKQIYVECKAYRDNSHISSEVIMKLMGVRNFKKYQEAWLISTAEFSKDAKGVVDEISNESDASAYTFYSPEKLIQALVNAGQIRSHEVVKIQLEKELGLSNVFGEGILLVTKYGLFWTTPYLVGGEQQAVIAVYANSGVIVREAALLRNLSNTDSSLKNLDFLKFCSNLEGTVSFDSESMALNKPYLDKINKIDIRFTHPEKDEIFLEDIFVYPDLEILDDKIDGKIYSDKILTTEGYERSLVLGDDVAGKTSLAFMLQKSADKLGFIALYINGEEIKSSKADRFEAVLRDAFHNQYENNKVEDSSFETVLSLNKEKIFLFIDNFESLGIKQSKFKIEFVKMLTDRFDHVILFSNSSLQIEVMVKSETREIFNEFKKLGIKQYGHVLRDELVEKWLNIGRGEEMLDNDILVKKDEIARKIKIIVGANFLPTYPLFLLTMLQLVEADSKNKLQGSSYAELYRYLINQSLGQVKIKPDDLDFYHTYLSYVAHEFFLRNIKVASLKEMKEIYEEYCSKMDVDKKFETVHTLLLGAKILRWEHELYAFNHNYGYYFFAAKYFADNLEETKIKKQVTGIIKRLYRSDFANIVIFLIHHSKSKEIIEEIINEAKTVFSSIEPSTLSENELKKVNNLIQEEINTAIEDKTPNDHRRQKLEHDDEHEKVAATNLTDESSNYTENIQDLDLFGKINLSFKLIEILGQIAHNYYGSLDGARKVEILEEVHSLGFRTLNALIQDFEKYIDSIRLEIQKELEKQKSLSQEKRDEIANKIIFSFTEMLVIFFVKKISDSMASKNLFITLDKILERYDTPSTRLVNMAAKLNLPNIVELYDIKELEIDFQRNHLAKRVLRFLVIEHIYKFDISISEKQRLLDLLKISTKQNKHEIQRKMLGN